MSNIRIQAAAFSLLALVLLTLAPQAHSASSEPNAIIEASGEGLARLEVELRPKGGKEVLRFEFKETEGLVIGAISLPGDAGSDYEITAYDALGMPMYSGKGSIPSLLEGDRPLQLTLSATGEEKAGLFVSLSRGRLVVKTSPADEPNSFKVEFQALDPRGNPMKIDPNDIKWGLTDPTHFELLPLEYRHEEIVVRPRENTVLRPFAELCDVPPKIVLCVPDLNCRVISVCSDPWVTISAGHSHTCALKKSGAAYCWGSNNEGELAAVSGDACIIWSAAGPKCNMDPLRVECPAGAPCRFTQIAAGHEFTVAIDTKGDTWSWGRTARTPRLVSAISGGKFVRFEKITAGDGYGCGLSGGGEIWCWGENHVGQAGAPLVMVNVPFNSAVHVLTGMKFSKVVAAGQHTCALNSAGDGVACWGRDQYNQTTGPSSTRYPLGTGQFFFQHFGGATMILDLAVSEDSSCVTLGSGNGVSCWGKNSSLTRMPFGTPEQLFAGSGHLCTISAQQASCMGANNAGQLGDGTYMAQASPVAVGPLPPLFSDLSAGTTHTCGLTPDGDAYCWGRNVDGQIGNHSIYSSVAPPAKVDAL